MGESQESCLQGDREDSAGKETSSKPPGEDYDQYGHGGQCGHGQLGGQGGHGHQDGHGGLSGQAI